MQNWSPDRRPDALRCQTASKPGELGSSWPVGVCAGACRPPSHPHVDELITTPHGVDADPAVGDLRVGPVGEPVQRPSRSSANARVLLLLIEGRRDRQDNRDRTSGPVPAAMGRGRTATFRAASAGLDGNQASPLMLFQQSAEFSVLRPQGSLCIAHTVMIADRQDARHACGVSGLSKVRASWHRTRSAPPRLTGR
jgi:hypothetical protein